MFKSFNFKSRISTSMRDNLIFYNVEENEEENSTEIVHSLLESNFKIHDAKSIKIDRAHRMGKKQRGAAKPRAIVAKFNYFPPDSKTSI